MGKRRTVVVHIGRRAMQAPRGPAASRRRHAVRPVALSVRATTSATTGWGYGGLGRPCVPAVARTALAESLGCLRCRPLRCGSNTRR